ncbi:hypothetical protein AC731_008995 [Thauera humireducens]|uniref:Uncharacterized protein n=1 Tax=Thauera humireducens TaxID=1134435 RepID=A0A127K539_9RHOO|nr:hypothetical protein AC731_008995 [Thauera humireducens]
MLDEKRVKARFFSPLIMEQRLKACNSSAEIDIWERQIVVDSQPVLTILGKVGAFEFGELRINDTPNE